MGTGAYHSPLVLDISSNSSITQWHQLTAGTWVLIHAKFHCQAGMFLLVSPACKPYTLNPHVSSSSPFLFPFANNCLSFSLPIMGLSRGADIHVDTSFATA